MMKSIKSWITLSGFTFIVLSSFAQDKKIPESTEIWEPQPRIITPAEKSIDAPSDAIILFDGKNLDHWTSIDGTPAKWTLRDGEVMVLPGSGDIKTKKQFGDFQLHVEWHSPIQVDPTKTGQGRGNSGIFLQGLYETQVLDNYNNKTYGNGQSGSIYKQHMPLVNACKKPGEWQVYEIFFTAARFNAEGRVIIPAYATITHNGVLVQNHVALWGPTQYIGLPVYKPTEKGPIHLQDHGNLVGFRNIWIRDL